MSPLLTLQVFHAIPASQLMLKGNLEFCSKICRSFTCLAASATQGNKLTYGNDVVCCCTCTGRVHLVKVQLPAAYPEAAPLVTAQLPEQVKLPAWQPGACSLRSLIKNHEDAIASLQDLWACLEDLDRCVGRPAILVAQSDNCCAL